MGRYMQLKGDTKTVTISKISKKSISDFMQKQENRQKVPKTSPITILVYKESLSYLSIYLLILYHNIYIVLRIIKIKIISNKIEESIVIYLFLKKLN
jgi:hypothetical protein